MKRILEKVFGGSSNEVSCEELEKPLGLDFYNEIYPQLKKSLEGGVKVRIILGSHVVVSDENIKARIDEDIKLSTIHTMFELSKEYGELLSLYIRVDGKTTEVRQASIDDKNAFISTKSGRLEYDNPTAVNEIKENFELLLKQDFIKLVDHFSFPREKLKTLAEEKDNALYNINSIAERTAKLIQRKNV